MATVIETISPGEAGEFDALKPRLRDLELGSEGVAKCVHLLVSAVLVPLVGLGERGLQLLKEALAALSKAFPAATASVTDVIIQNAVQDVLCAISAVSALLHPAAESPHLKLEEITSAKKGPLFMLRQTLMSQPFWSGKVAEVERCGVACTTMGPKVAQLVQQIQAGSAQAVETAMKELQSFKAALRDGALEELEMSIATYYSTLLPTGDSITEAMIEKVVVASQMLSGAASHMCFEAVTEGKKRLLEHQNLQRLDSLTKACGLFGVEVDGNTAESFDPEVLDTSAWELLGGSLKAAKSQKLIGQFEPMADLVQAAISHLSLLVQKNPSLVEFVCEALASVTSSVSVDAHSVLGMWQATANMVLLFKLEDEFKNLTAFVDADAERKKIKAMIIAYRSCVDVKVDNIPASVVQEQKVMLKEACEILSQLAKAELEKWQDIVQKGLLKLASSSVMAWKQDIAGDASWATVKVGVQKGLLAPGKGAEAKKLHKEFQKASIAILASFSMLHEHYACDPGRRERWD